MNVSILLKILAALCNFTELTPAALALKQQLELILGKDPESVRQLNFAVAQCLCADYATFEDATKFIASCLTQGQAARLPEAMGQFQRIASQVVG